MTYPDSVNDQPSYVDSNGNKEWYKNGLRHRDGGPAIEWANGAKEWWKNGQRHRDGGPAIERASGTKLWYLNGVQYFPKQTVKQEKSKNDTNSICYFCGSKTIPLFGRQMICQGCQK